jgi:radical SAM family uncharacterized protein/radical SAM-linked protein
MKIKTVQDILPMVEQPSRYLGTEVNRVRKDPSGVQLRFALAFPDLYEIGMSHFGIQILYHILNSHKGIAAERVFAPGVDMERFLREANLPLTTLESQIPLTDVDIIGFSLLYELNYTNILTMLDLASIPFPAEQRDGFHPIVIAGGPCTANPEPVAEFFDAMVIGDGEEVIMEMAHAWLDWKQSGGGGKKTLLKRWSAIKGVYIPSLFKPTIDKDGFQLFIPKGVEKEAVERRIVTDLDRAPFPDRPIVPYARPVHDRLRIEISRGCTRGCRFCQAGTLYRPVRERALENLVNLAGRSIASTGYADISLLSLSTGDYTCIVPLMERLMGRCEADHIAISLPSLRAGTLTPEMMKIIKRIRKTGFTIAPEAGTQRLRDVINKNITEKDIQETVDEAFQLGWQVIKLYFMIGLPSETENDLQAIVDLVKTLRKATRSKKQNGKINVSVSTFIPKPHTPFQWATQESLGESKRKIEWLRSRLKIKGVHFKWQNPEISLMEGLWARGDRRLSRLLLSAYHKGCRLDGWSDQFRYELWREAISENDLDIDFFTTRERSLDEPLPWDHIHTGVERDYFKQEWERALRGQGTADCRREGCNACGVCDFKEVAPKLFENQAEKTRALHKTADFGETIYKRVKLSYSKTGQAKYFGHLEMVKIFLRCLMRAEIPVKFSEGFHPMPKISFDDPLPIGMESLEEGCYLTVPVDVNPLTVCSRLNEHLPEGLSLHGCEPASFKRPGKRSGTVAYRVKTIENCFSEKKIEAYLGKKDFFCTRTNRKGRLKKINLKDMVAQIERIAGNELNLALKIENGTTLRPEEVVREVFSLPEEAIKQARVVKTGSRR